MSKPETTGLEAALDYWHDWRELAHKFISDIAEGSPEDDARIWFENAPPEVRLAAFIRLRAKEDRNG